MKQKDKKIEKENKKFKVKSKKPMKTLFSLAQGDDENYKSVAAWFMGAKGENGDLLADMIKESIKEHATFRATHYKKEDEPYITNEIKASSQYKQAVKKMELVRKELEKKLHGSVPFFSQRYQAHMDWDTVLPGNIGYLTAMLYNQNNVATEGGPTTCQLEKEVGQQLCQLLGYERKDTWGHITADGTIANLEAMWVARNLKFYPLAIKKAILANMEPLKEALELTLNVYDEDIRSIKPVKFGNCTQWQLLNIECSEIMDLPEKIIDMCQLGEGEFDTYLKPFLLQNLGLIEYAREYTDIAKVKVFVPVTNHYSWPKSGTILGLGQNSIIGIPVDDNCRMNVAKLEEELLKCAENKIPVLMTVAVIGSTEEGVVDNLSEILEVRERIKQKGIQFNLHCDAAWGGYLRTLLVEPEIESDKKLAKSEYVPVIPLSPYAQQQYEKLCCADTITIDPHKAGFIPYPAGSLCYRDGRLRYLITFNADYIHSDPENNMGIFGVEGSKPGAAAAAVWMAHKTISLDKKGYGQILGECMFSTKLYYCYWLTLANKEDNFSIQTLIPLPEKIMDVTNSQVILQGEEEILNFIRNNIIGKNNEEIAANKNALALLQQIGSDVLINCFMVNFKVNGEHNHNLTLLNKLNEKLFKKFSITTSKQALENKVEYMLTLSNLNSTNYQEAFTRICGNWSIEVQKNASYILSFLINTILQPWPNSVNFIAEIMNLFKKGIQDCITEIESENTVINLTAQSEKIFADKVDKIPSDIEATPSCYYILKNSYAGYADADQQGKNKLFYWFFESMEAMTEETPMIIWLNGGPGASSLAGLFLENGPFTMKNDSSIVPNPYSWHQKAHMLFFDQPVGTGYSCEKGYECVNTEEEMAEQFVTALLDFYQKHQEYANSPLYITGESYAGKYIPYITEEITKRNQSGSAIPLEGIALGNGWMKPEEQTADQIVFAYMLGMVDNNQRKKAEDYYQIFQKDIENKDMKKAFIDGDKVSQYLVKCGGGQNIYDIRSWSDAPIEPLKAYLSDKRVKECIHVPEDVEWAFSDAGSEVADHLIDDLMAPVNDVIETVINTEKEGKPLYDVLLYTGNFDMSCGFTGTEQLVRKLNWRGKETWNALDRKVWYKLDIDGKTKVTQGCIKQYLNVIQIEIPMSGHQVPLYQPEISRDMIYKWIFKEEYPSYLPEVEE